MQFSARDAWEMMGSYAIFVAWLAVATRGHIFSPPYLSGLDLVLGAAGIGIVFILRIIRSRSDSTLSVDILKSGSKTMPFPIGGFPDEPVFAAPRRWKAILDAPRPRAVRLSSQGKLVVIFVPAMLAFFVFAAVAFQNPHTPPARNLMFAFVFALLVYSAVDGFRRELAALRLLRDGEVAMGWIADCWETYRKRQKIHITVEFRDTVGRLYARDFQVSSTEDSIDPGHPILVFFEALNPEKNTVACTTIFELADI
jgi:hypothetical protein